MLDANLKSSSVVIDSTTGAPNSYGPRATPIIPYLGDSTLFVDNASQSLLVIDPAGKVARVMAAPNPQDLMFLTGAQSYVDSKGRLLYRGFGMPRNTRVAPGANGAPAMPAIPDSNPILRADFETRTTDTIGKVKSQSGSRATISQNSSGQMVGKRTVNPVPAVDEWGVTSDGAVAFVRGQDYHIDWLNPDESRTSTGKIPFDWRRLTDEDKQKLIDSAKVAQEAQDARLADALKNGTPAGGAAAAGGGEARMMVVERAAGAAMHGGGGGGVSMPMSMAMPKMETEYVPLNEIPDYYPPIRQGAVRPDLDGNLWVLPTTSAQSQNGELVYDVINRQGELTQRVRFPAGRSLAGFGKGGVVYLMNQNADKTWSLEKTQVVDIKGAAQ
jgi:hypothetical protein